MFAILIFIVSLCLFYYYYKHSCVKEVALFDGHIPLLGHSLVFTKKDYFSLIKEFGAHADRNGGKCAVLLGPIPLYVIADAADATVILNKCIERPFIYDFSDQFYGDLLISAKGPVWKRNRKILDLAFKSKILEGYMDFFNFQASRLIQMIGDKADGGFVDITSELNSNVFETAFQTEVGPLPDTHDFIDKYVEASQILFDVISLRVRKPWMFFDVVYNFSKIKHEFDEALKFVTEGIMEAVKERKSKYLKQIKHKEGAEERQNGQKTDIITYFDIVLENSLTEDGCLFTDTQLGFLCQSVVMAATKSIPYQLLFTLVCIGSDEEVQQKIYKEIQNVLGDEESVTKEHLPKLIYLEAAIKEAIRLYPIGAVVSRQATEPVKLDNVTLPAGSLFLVHLWAINRSEKYWGAAAAEFKPDRWLNPDSLPEHPNAFASFVFGKRNCIGKLYAMMHMKTTLVHILRKYRIAADHKAMELTCYIMMQTKSGHLINFQTR